VTNRFWVTCFALWATVPVSAQAPAVEKGQPEVVTHEAPVTFSSRVNLVSVPVVIRDKDGRSVGGLKQEDFQLFDKGKAQVITKFAIQTSPPPAASAVSIAAQRAGSSGVVSTRDLPSKPELPDRYVAYFFDDIHMQAGDLLNARKAASRHLDTALDANTRAGVFTTSGRTTQVFTNDVAKLHDALNRIQPWTSINDRSECLQISYYIADLLIRREVSLSPFGVNPASQLASELLAVADNCLHHPEAPADAPLRYLWTTANNVLLYGLEETGSGLTVLRDLIARMSALPGGRTIVLVSPGFIMSMEQRNDENDIFEKAIHANVVINSLDIRGVYTPLRTYSYDSEFGHTGGGAPGPARQIADREEATESGHILAELAYGTGGTVHNDNDFEEGLKELAARPEFLYVLGFSPDNLKNDGSYHGLKVKLKDGAKFDIEARRGYWAPSHNVGPAEAAKEELKETMFSRDEIADIPLDVHADLFKPNGAASEVNKTEINVVARLEAKGLRFRKTDERNNDTLTVVTGLFDQNGNYISGIERVVELRLRDKSLEVLENSGISVAQSFSVSPGRYIVRVVVKDAEGGTTAARNTGIEVP
jgi:VWFA-related protein